MTPNQSSIPVSILSALYDFTGNKDLGRGYLLFHTDGKGDISVVMQTETSAIKTALIATATAFVDRANSSNDFS